MTLNGFHFHQRTDLPQGGLECRPGVARHRKVQAGHAVRITGVARPFVELLFKRGSDTVAAMERHQGFGQGSQSHVHEQCSQNHALLGFARGGTGHAGPLAKLIGKWQVVELLKKLGGRW